MADVKITELTELAESPAASDVVPVVDVSASTTKKLTFTNLFSYITGAISTLLTANLTASRALVSGSGGKIEASTVTSTEVGYLTSQTDYTNTRPVVNLLYSGNFDLWDKGTSPTTADDTYVLPGVLALVSGGTWAVTQQTSSLSDGSRYALRIARSTGTLTMAGIAFFLEAQDAIPLRNKVVSLSMKVKCPEAGVKAHIASWDGTADSITSDMITAYADNLTYAANWTEEGQNSVSADAGWQTLKVENISLDTASFNNIAVIIRCLSIAGSAVTLDIAQVQLEIGTKATQFVPRPVAQEELLANRRFWRLAGDASGNGPAFHQRAGAASEALRFWIPFPVKMRTTPTGSVGGTWALVNCTGPTLGNISPQGGSMIITSSASGLASAQTNGTDDYLQFDVEL
jgi:hypothetical protein